MELYEKELTYRIRGCFFEVHYHQALALAFAHHGIPARSKDPIQLHYRNHPVLQIIPDFVVDDKVVLELKSARNGFAQENYVANFGKDRLQVQAVAV